MIFCVGMSGLLSSCRRLIRMDVAESNRVVNYFSLDQCEDVFKVSNKT